MSHKKISGNSTIVVIVVIAVILLIGIITAYHYLKRPLPPTSSKKVVTENFYSEPAGVDTRLPSKDYVPKNTIEDVNVIKNSPIEKFENQLYKISFNYPKYWGTPKITPQNTSLDIDWLNSCLDKKDLENIDKIVQPLNISFENTSCSWDWCSASVDIYNFDKDHHYQLLGYEGSCSLFDIYKIEEEIKTNSNLNINGHKATTKDGMFPPSRSYMRTVKLVPNGDQLYEISAGYKFVNDEYNRMPSGKDKAILDTLIENNPNNPDFEIASLFLQDFTRFYESLVK